MFCNTKAPIQKIIELAQRIADRAKKLGDVSALAYEVLESFDDVTGDLDEHRRKWLSDALKQELKANDESEDKEAKKADPLVLTAGALSGAYEPLRRIAASDQFPTRQLYARVHAWRKGETGEVERADKRLKAPPVGEHVETAVGALTGNNPGVGHLHLLQMLPYIPRGGEK